MAQTFEEYVTEWYALKQEIAKRKAEMADIVTREMSMRKAIAESIDKVMPLKEGVNKMNLPDGRVVKLTHKLNWKVDVEHLSTTREKFEQINDRPVEFDDLLRVKYELDKKSYNKLGDNAKTVVSSMLTVSPAAPDIEIVDE